MYRYCVGIVVTFALFACMSGVRAVAAPGMTWTDEKAWLTNTPQVEADTITHAYDSSLGVNKASADVKMPYKLWTVSITLTKGDVVTDETFTPRKAGAGYKMQAGNGPTANLLKTLYGSNSDVAKEYANASTVATVPINGQQASEQFFQAKGGKYGFMLSPSKLVVFSSSEMQQRIKQAKYCSTHSECGE